MQSSNLKPWLRIMCFTLGLAILAWNEKNAVETSELLNSTFLGIKRVDNIYTIDKGNEGELVYLCGPIHVEEPLTEPEYGISVPAVILKRRVQMYQWVEVEKDAHNEEEQGGTSLGPKVVSEKTYLGREEHNKEVVYTYYTDWKDKLLDSSLFQHPAGHQNPRLFPLSSYTYISDKVRIGAYLLSGQLKQKFTNFVLITSDERPEKRDIKMHAGLYYHSIDVWNPSVGDVRIQFSYAGNSGDMISVIAVQNGSYVGVQGNVLMEPGRVPAEDMINKHHSGAISNRQILQMLTLWNTCSARISFPSLTALTVIASTWLYYKPFVGATIVVVTLLPIVLTLLVKQKQAMCTPYRRLT